ncbi:protein-export chaperone SecB [Pantoea agglomerans]|uniref:protein-export chaperone SecB n=1 Tax=Enterobacter agglomerans TaxID=549 RepID=UPI001F249488|nr:protein-export chaperone SecB [Pantoea agglomerans]UJL36647.1 protein-export chaperone SecB [Pantoea agglomerans]
MKLRLQDSKVNQLLLVEADGQTIESDFSLGFEPVYHEENLNLFTVMFDFAYITEDDKYLRIDFQCNFTTDGQLDDEFKNSKFPVVNAPAIAFPFLRAFVANFLMSSGYKPILLPSINFVNFSKEEISKPQ